MVEQLKDKHVYYLCFLLDPQHRELSLLNQPEFLELRSALPDPPLTKEQEFVQHIFEADHEPVQDLRDKLQKHFHIQQFLDTLEKHDMTLAELYIQDNYWLQSQQCHGKGCQDLSLHNLNQGQFLCDAMHTYKDHECVQNIRAIMEDLIKEKMALRKIKLLEEHAATPEEIDAFLKRISSMEDFQKMSAQEQQSFISFFRDQPTPADTVEKVFYDSDGDDEEEDQEVQEEEEDLDQKNQEEDLDEKDQEEDLDEKDQEEEPEDQKDQQEEDGDEKEEEEDGDQKEDGEEEEGEESKNLPSTLSSGEDNSLPTLGDNSSGEETVDNSLPTLSSGEETVDNSSPTLSSGEETVDNSSPTLGDNTGDPSEKKKHSRKKKLGGGGGGNGRKRSSVKDDDVILKKVFPKMIHHLSTVSVSLGLTARQVMRGLNGQPTWKERVFRRKQLKEGGGGGGGNKVKEARQHEHNEAWWNDLHNLEGLKQELETKLQKCGDGVNDDDCKSLTQMFERVQEKLVKKAAQTSNDALQQEEAMINDVLAPLQEKGIQQKQKQQQLEETRSDLQTKKDELRQIKTEIEFYESSIKTETSTEERRELQSLLEEARQDERDLLKEVEFLQKQEADLASQTRVTAVITEQANQKLKDLTGIDILSQFQKNLSDALDERIAENTGVIMTLYLKSIVFMRRRLRNWIENYIPKDAVELHKKNMWDSNRTWFGEKGFFSKTGVTNAAWSAVATSTRAVALFATDALYFIAKNQYLMTALLLALKTVKQRICKQIQMHLFTVELDTQQLTSKEMAAQLLRTFRLYVPTQMIPKGQEMIRNGLEGAKLMLNMTELQSVKFIGPALNSVTFIIVMCASDAYEEMCAANFMMTTATNLIETLDWFQCFKEPMTEKLNQSMLGFKDLYTLWNMETYDVQCIPHYFLHGMIPNHMSSNNKNYDLRQNYFGDIRDHIDDKYPNHNSKELKCRVYDQPTAEQIRRFSKVEYGEDKYQENKGLLLFDFVLRGLATPDYASCGDLDKTFEEVSPQILHVKDTRVYVEATKRNIDILYMLLADEVLTVDQIQPPKLEFPLGHWTKYGARFARNKAANQLLTETYKDDLKGPDPFDFYTMFPTDKEQRHIFDVHTSNLRGKFSQEKRDRELCKKYIQNYDRTKHDGKVFKMDHKKLKFVDSTYSFKTSEQMRVDRKKDDLEQKEKIGGGGAKTLSWSRVSNNSNNTTRKIIL